MTLRIGVSRSADRRLEYATKALGEWTGLEHVRILAPTTGAADDFVRERGVEPGTGRGGLHRGTLFDTALEIARPLLTASGTIPLAGVAGEAVIARTIARFAGEGPPRLEYFSNLATTMGFRRALAETVRELRLGAVAASELDPLGPSGPDLAQLLAAYEDELAGSGLTDRAGVLAMAAARLGSHPDSAPDAVLVIDPDADTPREREFVRALLDATPHAVMVLDPARFDEIGTFSGSAKTPEVETIEETSPGEVLARLRSFVFEQEVGPARAPGPGFEFFSATDESREAVEIARRIHRASADGRPFDRMAILLRDPETYQPLVADALSRAGIPACFTRGTTRPNPSGRAFLALLATAEEGLSAARFADYLSLGQVRPPSAAERDGSATEPNGNDRPDSGTEDHFSPAAPAQWEKLLVEAAVVGGASRWERRLAGLIAEFRHQVAHAATEDDQTRIQVERKLERLRALADFSLPLIRRLDALPSEATWGAWIETLWALAGEALSRPEGVQAVLAELEPLGGVGPVSLGEVRRVLFDRLGLLGQDPPRRYGGVFVGAISEAAGRAFDVVFLPGLAEGRFPRRSLEDPLLLDRARASLGPGRVQLEDRRTAGERRLLRLALGAATESLFVSYPRTSLGRGRGQVPSFYALDLLRAAEARLPELGELEHIATAAGLSRLGWPAPRNPDLAIDDAEYDLAVIGRITQTTGGITETKSSGRGVSSPDGRAHYLVTVNDSLTRSLRTRARRWRNFWSSADGIYDPDPETRALLTMERPRSRTYSPTALERYAACPYRFLLGSVLHLSPREEWVSLDQMNPLTRGGLFHTVQFRLLTRLSEADLLPVTTQNSTAVRVMADDCLDRAASEYREELAPPIDRIWNNDVEDLRTDLHGWLRMLARDPESTGWTPIHFEYGFGLHRPGERDPASTAREATILGGVHLRGAIDLIEERARGGLLRVVDHKTGRVPAPAPNVTGGGRFLQPLLYALVAESLFERRVATADLYYCTERGGFRRVAISIDERSRNVIENAIGLIDRSVDAGFLTAAPEPDACTRCDFRVVCGPYEETRTRNKHSRGDEPAVWAQGLRELRELP